MRPERQTAHVLRSGRIKNIEKVAELRVRLVRGLRRGFRPPTTKGALPLQTRPQAELAENDEKQKKSKNL